MKTSLRSYVFFLLLLVIITMSLSFFVIFRFSVQQYIVVIAEQQIPHLLHQVESLVLLITLILTLVFTPLIWLMSGQIVKPLRDLRQYAAQLGNGDFQIPRIHSSIQEIEDLSGTFSTMASNLDESIQSQKSFFQNASHELRTPLMSIEGYAQGLLDGIFPDPSMAVDIVITESEKMIQLIDGILTLARLDARQQELNPVSIDVCEFIEQLIHRFYGIAISRKREIVFQPEAEELYVHLDPVLLEKSCSNLLSNALQYAKEYVYIDLKEQDSNILLTIENDGSRLEEEDIAKIYQRFYKGEKGNFGIGLSMVKSAVEYMNGTILAENGFHGARFTLILKKENETALSHD